MAYFIKALNSEGILTTYKSGNFKGVLFYSGEDSSVWQMFLDVNIYLSKASRHLHWWLRDAGDIWQDFEM